MSPTAQVQERLDSLEDKIRYIELDRAVATDFIAKETSRLDRKADAIDKERVTATNFLTKEAIRLEKLLKRLQADVERLSTACR